MYKKTIKYVDYDGNEREEDYYFNLSRSEIMEMNFSKDGNLVEYLERIKNTVDVPKIAEFFKELIMKSYGEKSLDGKAFRKKRDGHLLVEEFMETEAFTELYMELATDADAASAFVSGIIPSDMSKPVAKTSFTKNVVN